MVFGSLRERQDFLQNTFGIPSRLSINSFIFLFEKGGFFSYIYNSIIVLGGTLALTIFLSATTAYGIGRFDFRYKSGMRAYFLLGLMFPVQLTVIPLFSVMRGLGLVNNPLSVILVLSAGISMPVLIMTSFFANLPRSLHESAWIDGAGEWRIFFQIMFPLASPVVLTASIIIAIQTWNQFFLPLIFLQSESVKTVPLAIAKYTSRMVSFIDLAFAASVVSTLPVIVLFFIFSRRVLDGVTTGALKE